MRGGGGGKLLCFFVRIEGEGWTKRTIAYKGGRACKTFSKF